MEVITGVAWVMVNSPREILRSLLLAATSRNHAKVVVHLRERHANRQKLERAFGLGEVSARIGGQAKIEIRLARYRRRMGDLLKRRHGQVIIVLSVVSFPKFEPGAGECGAQAGCVAIVPN